MRFGFSYIGLIWLIMLFVPNMIWTKNKPQDYEKYVESENKVLLAMERLGQFIVTPVSLFFSKDAEGFLQGNPGNPGRRCNTSCHCVPPARNIWR